MTNVHIVASPTFSISNSFFSENGSRQMNARFIGYTHIEEYGKFIRAFVRVTEHFVCILRFSTKSCLQVADFIYSHSFIHWFLISPLLFHHPRFQSFLFSPPLSFSLFPAYISESWNSRWMWRCEDADRTCFNWVLGFGVGGLGGWLAGRLGNWGIEGLLACLFALLLAHGDESIRFDPIRPNSIRWFTELQTSNLK